LIKGGITSSNQGIEVSLYVGNESQPPRLKAFIFGIHDPTQNALATIMWEELHEPFVDQGQVNHLECCL
jgi:hypothetical protein